MRKKTLGKKKTVLIIDDHPLFREGIKSLFARQSLFNLIGEAKNGKEGIKKAIDLKPDIVVMDLSLPDQNGMEVTRKILDILPKTHIMILSMHSKVDYIIDAFRAGAKGYVIKESAAERLIECLKSVSKGEYFLDPFLSHMVAKNLMESDVKTSR
ncbi:MAG TPA: response regulator transcription factor, partial [Desulfobacteraceae bacterium]|nr:response regulator transcription factor [Desulfobacteraceae bacterium]